MEIILVRSISSFGGLSDDFQRGQSFSLAEGIVTEDISEGGKAYKTSEVGDWLAAKILA
jgi:hypothetical protein